MIAEEEMIRVEDRERIRRAYFVEHKSMRQIARELRHGRDTVKKAIESAEPATYTLKKPRRAPVLGPYKARIDELLDYHRRRWGGLRASQMAFTPARSSKRSSAAKFSGNRG